MTDGQRHVPGGLLGLARAAVFWERLWRLMWPAVLVAGLFVGLALLGVPSSLPGWVHLSLLCLFAAAFLFLLFKGVAGLGGVTLAEGRFRLERDNDLGHRPLEALADDLAAGAGDVTAEALWQAHRRQAAIRIDRLRLTLPSPGLARKDPLALRIAVGLVIAAGLIAGWGEMRPRLLGALAPNLFPPPPELALDVWITPPTYTGRAPLYLKASTTTDVPLEVPEGSAVLIQAGGIDRVPWLQTGDARAPFDPIGSETWRAEALIETGGRLAVGQGGRELRFWPISMIADEPPSVQFAEPPTATERGRLRVNWDIQDDYGVTDLTLLVRREGSDETVRVSLPLPMTRQVAEGRSAKDLTAHPWAGVTVDLALEVGDALGQRGRSLWLESVLPERPFRHPVARAIVAQRKRLVESSPEVRAGVAAALDVIGATPGAYGGDTVVHLALRVARDRLIFGRGEDAVPSVREMLWSSALRLEEGDFSLAERQMASLTDALRRALESGADPESIERLGAELRQVLDRYLQALMEELQRRGLTDMPFDGEAMTIEGNALKRLVDEIRDLAEAGNKELARQRLAQLQALLDDMGMQIRSGAAQERMAEAARVMRGLRNLEQRQKELMDETYRRLRESPGRGQETGGADPSGIGGGASEQQSLREDLNRVIDRAADLVGRAPGALTEADRAMSEAATALATGQPEEAVRAQGEALDKLQRARGRLTTELSRRRAGMPGLFGRTGRPGRNADPFGRQPPGGLGTALDGSVKIPGKAVRGRVRAILDELQRRAGERTRPQIERDYIDRLLRRY